VSTVLKIGEDTVVHIYDLQSGSLSSYVHKSTVEDQTQIHFPVLI